MTGLAPMATKISDLVSANLENVEFMSHNKKSWLTIFADNSKRLNL